LKLQSSVTVAFYRYGLRVEHDKVCHAPFPVAKDSHEKVSIEQERNNCTIPEGCSGKGNIGALYPFGLRAESPALAVNANKAIHRERANRGRDKAHCAKDSINLESGFAVYICV
jgi:hypothetical protein